jgi:hypothetical protein
MTLSTASMRGQSMLTPYERGIVLAFFTVALAAIVAMLAI